MTEAHLQEELWDRDSNATGRPSDWDTRSGRGMPVWVESLAGSHAGSRAGTPQPSEASAQQVAAEGAVNTLLQMRANPQALGQAIGVTGDELHARLNLLTQNQDKPRLE